MLLKPLPSEDETVYRRKLAQWHPEDGRQDEHLNILQEFLSRKDLPADTVRAFRALYDLLLAQFVAIQEIDAEAIAAGRKSVGLSPLHPLVQAAFGKAVDPSTPFREDTTSIVDHLREADLNARARKLGALLEAAESALQRD